jgi:hypothetical protein
MDSSVSEHFAVCTPVYHIANGAVLLELLQELDEIFVTVEVF